MGELLQRAYEMLERVGCQFWACRGPDEEPEYMVTCQVCWLIRDLRKSGKVKVLQ